MAASRKFVVAGFTTEAVADGASMANNKYMAIKGGSSTQQTKIKGVYVCGLETTTVAPQKLLLSLDSTVGTSLTALSTGESDAPNHPATAALAAPVLTFTAVSGTAPIRAKSYLWHCGFNALGGIANINFPKDDEPWIVGASANGGEISLSGFTGTTAGLIGAHIKYETL